VVVALFLIDPETCHRQAPAPKLLLMRSVGESHVGKIFNERAAGDCRRAGVSILAAAPLSVSVPGLALVMPPPVPLKPTPA